MDHERAAVDADNNRTHPAAEGLATTTWGPVGATLATLAVVALSFVAAIAPVFLFRIDDPHMLGLMLLLVTIAISQIVMGAGGWWLAGLRGGQRSNALSLGPMQVSVKAAAFAILGMIAVTLSYQAFRAYVLGHDIFADMREMLPLFRSPFWPLSFVLVSLIAPLAEEILFRGFLLNAFMRSRAGFWSGVAVATLIWTALHVQYKFPALLLVAIMGVMFSLMLRWSGSLRLPLVAHAINNSIASLYLLYLTR